MMFFRLYFVIRCRFNYSIYNDAYSKKLCKDHGFYPSNWFILKLKFIKVPAKTISAIFVSTVFILSMMIMTVEIENLIEFSEKNNQSILFNAVYFTMITMTTVGYGDVSPQTYLGKTIVMFTAVWGTVMVSFVVLVVSNAFNLT